VSACTSDSECTALAQCISACSASDGGDACTHDCRSMHSTAIAEEQAVADCATSRCAADCP
jgi:hypothetical protein